MRGTNGNSGTKGSHETLVAYKQTRKPLMSKEEKAREKASFRRYTISGGDEPE